MTVKEMGPVQATSPAFLSCIRAQDFRSMADDEHHQKLSTPTYLDGHRLYRERIISEDQLIHYRTSWGIWIQTVFVIIVGGLAVHLTSETCSSKNEQLYVQLIYSVCALGSLAAVFSSASIVAALREINNLKKRYEKYFRRHSIDAPWLPDITASTWLHVLGHAVNTVGPLVVVVAWGCLALEIYLRCH
ncbi:MAG TPA: hypothetical protein VMF32_11765 [Xanthobacteraceae bacterium]|nr:hypothetical protein [Xanthobacteraceae bacterium]